MRCSRTLLALALTVLLVAPNAMSQQGLTDPHKILNAHYDALGGLERLKAKKTLYLEGTISVMNLDGTFRDWEEFPDLKRRELDLGVIKMTMGDNGQFGWMVDMNGKLQIQKDEASLKKRQVWVKYSFKSASSPVSRSANWLSRTCSMIFGLMVCSYKGRRVGRLLFSTSKI